MLRAPVQFEPVEGDASKVVPLLMITGQNDVTVSNSFLWETFASARGEGALWGFAEEPGTVHLVLTDKFVALVAGWTQAVLDGRLPVEPGGPLRALDESTGWIGDFGTRSVVPVGAYSGNPLSAAWLPTQQSAELWRQLVTP